MEEKRARDRMWRMGMGSSVQIGRRGNEMGLKAVPTSGRNEENTETCSLRFEIVM